MSQRLSRPLDRLLAEAGACYEGSEWAARHRTIRGAWDACERPDWMLWALGKAGADHGSRLLRLMCRLVRRVWAFVPADVRPAVVFVEEVAEGKRPADGLEDMRRKLYRQVVKVRAATRRSAAFAAYYCTIPCPWASYVGYVSDNVIDVVRRRAKAGDKDAAVEAEQKKHCDLIRELWPKPPRSKWRKAA
jgi:hypothetical protein